MFYTQFSIGALGQTTTSCVQVDAIFEFLTPKPLRCPRNSIFKSIEQYEIGSSQARACYAQGFDSAQTLNFASHINCTIDSGLIVARTQFNSLCVGKNICTFNYTLMKRPLSCQKSKSDQIFMKFTCVGSDLKISNLGTLNRD